MDGGPEIGDTGWRWIFGTAIGVLTAAFGWLWNSISRNQDRIEKAKLELRGDDRDIWSAINNIRDNQTEMIKSTATKDDLNRLEDRLVAAINKIGNRR